MEQNKKWILLIGLCLIALVKFFIRPFITIPSELFLCRDVAPNLISAFLIPFGADLFLKRWVQLIEKRNVLFICAVGLIVITLNELAQLFPVFRRTFDYFDLVFSFIGVSIGYLVFTRYFMCASSKEAIEN
jgi:glycopeptide antibiotics resistance protein